MPDLTEPRWRPEYTGDDSLGDVASDGRRLGAHLFYLYRAGRNELPEIAAVYAGLTRQVHGISGPMSTQFERRGRGMEQAHLRLLDLRDVAHVVLRQTCLRMLEVGQALVETADEYAATDHTATEEFSRLLDKHAEDYRDPMPPEPRPPRVDDPPPGSPPPGVQY